MEELSDAVIGFAITLLIVSLEVPRTFDDLMTAVRGFAAFAISFALIIVIWYEHDQFFRRYGLQSRHIIVLNSVLLFLILFYVYPLKFLVALTINPLLGVARDVVLPTGAVVPMIRADQLPLLFLLYGIGWTAVFGIFALFYQHALSHRVSLALNAVEVFLTRAAILENAAAAGLGILSMILAFILPLEQIGLAGWIFLLMFPLHWALGRWKRTRRAQLDSASAAQETLHEAQRTT